MKNSYIIFVLSFFVSIIALTVLIIGYVQSIIHFVDYANQHSTYGNNDMMPSQFFRMIFTPTVVISFVILIIASLLYRILGIVFVVRNPNLESNNRVLFILGFIFLSFITAIIFMALKNSKNLLATEKEEVKNF